jgi:hypothetical protein
MVTAFRAAIFLDVAIRPWPLKLNAEDAATMATGLNKLGVWGKGGSHDYSSWVCGVNIRYERKRRV